MEKRGSTPRAAPHWRKAVPGMCLLGSWQPLPRNLAPRIGFASRRLAPTFTGKGGKAATDLWILRVRLRRASRSQFRWPATHLCRSCALAAEEVITHSAEETSAWGREFAKRLTAPTLVLLSGDLGAGKTT